MKLSQKDIQEIGVLAREVANRKVSRLRIDMVIIDKKAEYDQALRAFYDERLVMERERLALAAVVD